MTREGPKGAGPKASVPKPSGKTLKRPRGSSRAEEGLIRSILDSLADNIALLDERGRIVTVNKAWERFAEENGDPGLIRTGVGQDYLEVCRKAVGEDAPLARKVLAGIQGVLDGSAHLFSIEYPCHSPEEKRWFLMYVTGLEGPAGGAVVSHVNITQRRLAEMELEGQRDKLEELVQTRTDDLLKAVEGLKAEVAERKDAEEALRKRKATLRSIFKAAPVGIGLVADRVIIQANDRLLEMAGYPAAELLGQSSRMLYPSDEEYERVGREKYEQIRERGTGTVETRWMRNDGEVIDVLLSSTPLDPSDLSIGVTFTALDITDRKRAEKKLQAANEELRSAYEGLKKAQETAIAQEKLAAVGRLMAGVSHEIMSPLNAVSLFIHVYLEDPATPPEMAEDLKTMRDQVERISKLAKNLLYTARQRKPERGPVDLNELVRKSLGLVGHEMRYKNIEVELAFEEGLEPIFADHDQLQQVVLNLLNNAEQATPAGGRISLSTCKLAPLPGSSRTLVEFRVEDTGAGIAPKNMEKLFEPFFTTKPEGEGTGLGLAICQGIVEAHGGRIWAENVDGGGAAFAFQLPMGEKKTQADGV